MRKALRHKILLQEGLSQETGYVRSKRKRTSSTELRGQELARRSQLHREVAAREKMLSDLCNSLQAQKNQIMQFLSDDYPSNVPSMPPMQLQQQQPTVPASEFYQSAQTGAMAMPMAPQPGNIVTQEQIRQQMQHQMAQSQAPLS